MDLIILAAGKSKRIYKKININKCLLDINGKSIIKNIVDDALSLKFIKKISIVVGFKKSNIINNLGKKNINYIVNKKYDKTEMMYSLYLALKNTKDDVIISYSDIFFKKKIFQKIYKNKSKKQIILPINMKWTEVWKKRKKSIYKDCETLRFDKKNNLTDIGDKISKKNLPMGQFMGLLYIPKYQIKLIVNFIKSIQNKKMHLTKMLSLLIKYKYQIRCIKYHDLWYEVDDIADYQNINK